MGTLRITEYNNMGDVGPTMPQEPPTRVQKVALGDISERLHPDTRLVALYSDLPCRVAFFADGAAEPEDGFGMSDNYEIQRQIHMGTGMRVKTFDA